MSRQETIDEAVRRAIGNLKGRADPDGMLRYWLNVLSVPMLNPMVAFSVQTVIKAEFSRLKSVEASS